MTHRGCRVVKSQHNQSNQSELSNLPTQIIDTTDCFDCYYYPQLIFFFFFFFLCVLGAGAGRGGGAGTGTRPFISGEQKSKTEGNRGTKAILGNREHSKSRF